MGRFGLRLRVCHVGGGSPESELQFDPALRSRPVQEVKNPLMCCFLRVSFTLLDNQGIHRVCTASIMKLLSTIDPSIPQPKRLGAQNPHTSSNVCRGKLTFLYLRYLGNEVEYALDEMAFQFLKGPRKTDMEKCTWERSSRSLTVYNNELTHVLLRASRNEELELIGDVNRFFIFDPSFVIQYWLSSTCITV